MRQRAELPLCSSDLEICDFRIDAVAERLTVRPRMVADPMPLVVGALGQLTPSRLNELLADHEERRAHAVSGEERREQAASPRVPDRCRMRA